MNINFVEDLENSVLEVVVEVKKRMLAGEKRIKLGWHELKKIVDKEYKCPDTHILGECTRRRKNIDNDYDHMLKKIWKFPLILKKVPTEKPKSSKRSKSTKKQAAKK